MASQFTPPQRSAIRKLAAGVVAAATAGIVVLAVTAIQPQINDLNDRVTALESPAPSPEPSPSPVPSPTPTPSPSPTPIPSPSPEPSPAPEPQGPGGGVFSIRCNLDHQAPDDPIVFPGVPGASHNHSFFGAIGVDAFTTSSTLGGSLGAFGTTCTLAGDRAAYWAPSLVDPSGNLVKPAFMLAYYRSNAGQPVQTIPEGLKLVAGVGGGYAFDPEVEGFSCSDQSPYSSLPVSCPSKNVLHVVFPNCWDGVNLDSPDHRSHVVYANGSKCPADHPVKIAKLSLHFQFPKLLDPTGYRFASNPDGSQPAPHADFFNGWDPVALQALIDECANAGHDNSGPCKQPSS